MDELSRQYEQRIDRYNKLIADAIRNPAAGQRSLSQIRRLNTEIEGLLDKMMGQLAMARRSDAAFRAEKDKLYENLKRIQQDSNALTQDKDTLETLRRIREFRETDTSFSLSIYMIAFVVLALVVLLVLMFKRPSSQADMTSTIPSSPAAIPALT
jgi:hypothetical protein